jgi:nitrogen regulatory protein PII 1
LGSEQSEVDKPVTLERWEQFMKMIWAVIRPESTQRVIEALEQNGISAMTRLNVTGHGTEMGITAGAIRYSEIPKEMLMIAIQDNEVAKAVNIIKSEARTRTKNHPNDGTIGDGKIFVTYIEEFFTIRTSGKTDGSLKA